MMQIAILFGGSSYEHEISIVSAISLKKVLKKTELTFIFLDQYRDFYLIDASNMRSTYFANKEYTKATKLSLTHKGFVANSLFKKSHIQPKAVLNLVHGRDGEDGKIASLFDFYEISYIGPRIEASVLSYSKLLTKYLANALEVKALPYELLDNKKRETTLSYPLILKPLKLGSSIGVSIVKDVTELDYALDVALEFDDQVLVEPFVGGVKEYNLAGCKCDGEYIFSSIEEPQKQEFLDFEKKYFDFARTQKIFEADIKEELRQKLYAAFCRLYDGLFEGALIRCDFFVVDDEVLINEINPIPGSMANYLFDDFESTIQKLALDLPKQKKITIDYSYINTIASAKGKAQ
jgi:D-alanine-D-alanine ligase